MAATGLERRLKLQTVLEDVMEKLDLLWKDPKTGITNVYFSPGPSITLHYPCIIYDRANAQTFYGDNKPYMVKERYSITVIDEDPDSLIVPELEMLPTSAYDRHYEADNLNHDVFTMYF